MDKRVTPMIHVPNVSETVAWYRSIGFALLELAEDGGEVVFALLSFGQGRVMFNTGGHLSSEDRRDVDLYLNTEQIDELYDDLKFRVEIRETPHDTFYGTREFIIRDLNGFWITFGQPSAAHQPVTELRSTP